MLLVGINLFARCSRIDVTSIKLCTGAWQLLPFTYHDWPLGLMCPAVMALSAVAALKCTADSRHHGHAWPELIIPLQQK